MEQDETTTDREQPGHSLLTERHRLAQALLDAAAEIARGRNPEAILCHACNALVEASPHIRLAWTYLGDGEAELIRPAYAAGPARAFAQQFALGDSPVEQRSPVRQCLRMRRPSLARIATDPSHIAWRVQSERHGLASCICLPFGQGEVHGVVVVYADEQSYFERLGPDPFRAFAQIGRVAMEQLASRRRLQDSATLDHLTGLLNRGAMSEVLRREQEQARRGGRPFSVLMVDLDLFKDINDHYGHDVGDQVLRWISGLMGAAVRAGDWVGRWGGEEFLALLPDADHVEALHVGERLRETVEADRLRHDRWELSVTVSVGVATTPDDGASVAELLGRADANLYAAKRGGRNAVVGNSRPDSLQLSRERLVAALSREGAVRAAYQPIVELASGRCVGEEAMARLLLGETEPVAAGAFMETAIQLRLSHLVDYQVLRGALRRCVVMTRADQCMLHFVNVSPDLLRHPEILDELVQIVEESCGPEVAGKVGAKKPIVLEVREVDLLDNRVALEVLRPFLDFGMQLAVDQFGSAQGSLRNLADLPVSYIKLERGLVERAAGDRRVRALLRGLQETASAMDMITVAQQVERPETVDVLREIGVPWAQGYHFGRPALAL